MNVEELVVSNAGWIGRLARRYYSDEGDADDLASETIYKCLSNAHRFKPYMSFKPWAKVIMENTFKTRYNRRRCVLFTGIDGYDDIATEKSDNLTHINQIFSTVRECNRKSVCIESVLLYAKGYSIEEISGMLHIPKGTVKRRIHSGRQMLRERLDR